MKKKVRRLRSLGTPLVLRRTREETGSEGYQERTEGRHLSDWGEEDKETRSEKRIEEKEGK